MPSKPKSAPSSRTDTTRSGSQVYAPRDVANVFAALSHATRSAPISNADIEAATGVQGRTIRQIISDHSGLDHPVVCKVGTSGFFLPESYEDCEPTFRSSQRAIASAQTRLDREKTWASKYLERRQFALFDEENEDVEVDDDV